ncbi:HD domain-containing protein [Methanoregula sp.]|uniref:HD domain-containing protein n=1 Tax=Methanoregula sp. TaxID=2052170 RepID=UPI00236FB705|nr:HD domain-containing protein [Methanoregula sp.]MDD1686336.1 HD domain-containing protein [Methanoregula sp.]
MDPDIEIIRDHVRNVLNGSGSHGLDHIERVTALCEQIGREEHADMAILIPAALLHDIARPLEKEQGLPHEQEGARMAEEFLRSIQYDARCIPAIAAAIRTHRYRSKERPAAPEAQILSDADKLDALGAIGIARTFVRAGEHGGSIQDGIDHFHDKLLKLPDLMYTGTARRIARERHAFLVRFLAILEEELSIQQG